MQQNNLGFSNWRIFTFFYSIVIIFTLAIIDIKAINNSDVELIYQVSSEDEANRIAEQYNLEITRLGYRGVTTYKTNNQQIINELIELGFSKNHIRTMALTENDFNDPKINEQYALTLTNTFSAWEIADDLQRVMVAVIDTGIDINHDEFQNRLSPLSYNVKTEQIGLENVVDNHGHGTMVSGLIAANANNGIGIAGMAPNAEIMAIKAETIYNDKAYFYDEDIVSSIYYAVDNGAHIINMSLGGPNGSKVMEDAVNYANENGVFVVAAAGNDGEKEYKYPASFENVISVTAINRYKELAELSNFNDQVSLTAPGTEIISTTINNSYDTRSGTSLAAPQVSATLALMMGYYPNLTTDQILEKLYNSSEDLGEEGKDIYFGHGLIDVSEALRKHYYTITFETFSELYIEPIKVYEFDPVFLPDDPVIKNKEFQGWFLDEEFTETFEDGSWFLTSDLTLYAKFTPGPYIITLIINGEIHDELTVQYTDEFYPSGVTLDHYDIIGWTIDPEGTKEFVPQVIGNNITLYGQIIPHIYTVSLYSNSKLYKTLSFTYLEEIELPFVEQEGFNFLGWYYDEDFENKFNETTLTQNISLYAKLQHLYLDVIYYNSDGSMFYEYRAQYGTDLLYPEDPEKASVNNFRYEFVEWDTPIKPVITNLEVYPTFKKIYKKDSVTLAPNLDTLYQWDDWIDNGLINMDDNLSYTTFGRVNTAEVGSYLVVYNVIYAGETIDEIYRYVNVIEKPVVYEITLNPMRSTIYVGDKIIDTGIINPTEHEVDTVNNIDTSVIGTYTIEYTINTATQTIKKQRFIHVIPKESHRKVSYIYYRRKEENYEV